MVYVVSRVVSSSLFDLRGKHNEIEMLGCSATAGVSEVLSNKNVNLTWTDRLNFGSVFSLFFNSTHIERT